MRYIFVIIIACNAILFHAQNDTNELKTVFDNYRILIEQKKYDEAFDYYHPNFLKYIPKEQLKKQFTALNNSDKFEYEVKNSKLVFVSEVFSTDSAKYAFLRYGVDTYWLFKEEASDELIEKKKELFKSLYGKDFSYNEEKRELSFYKEQELIGIKENIWKLIIYKKKLNPYMTLWVPEEVLKKLLGFSTETD